MSKTGPKSYSLPCVAQCVCWHCQAYTEFTVVRHGLKCRVCERLNRYNWTEEQFIQNKQARHQ